MHRHVTAQLVLDVSVESRIDLQLAVADTGLLTSETLSIGAETGELPVTEVVVPGEGRVHRFVAPTGRLVIWYDAETDGRSGPELVTEAETVVYRRPSRYAESDTLAAVARAEFAGVTPGPPLLEAVSSWVGQHLIYIPGSSRPTDGAVATLLQRSGVCRDYAHLVVAMLRGLDIPARLAAVYAPGLDPMDFHAVAEAAVDGRWRAVDATLLAPRESLLRICTGRDAADTAFLSTYEGVLSLVSTEVTATVDPSLPSENVEALVSIG